MKRNLTISAIVGLAIAAVLSVSAQQNLEVAPRALPVAGPNDIARFLAGMPVPENSPLAPVTRDPAWLGGELIPSTELEASTTSS